MKYNRVQTIDNYFDQINSNKISFSELRPKLEKLNLEKEEINIVVRQIDRQLIRAAELKTIKSLGRNIFLGGIILSAIGAIITFGSLFNLFTFKGYAIITHGPICAGLIAVFYGFSQMNRE